MKHENIKIKFIRGLTIVRSSLAVISSVKLLLWLPVIGFVTNSLLLVLLMKYGFQIEFSGSLYSFGVYPHYGLLAALLTIVYFFLATEINVFLAGTVSHNVLARFNGKPMTLASSFKAAWHKKGPLLTFGLVSSLIGYILVTAVERLPFAGRLFAWVADVTWTAASFFAIPVIMMDKQNSIKPRQITVESTNALKALWKEGITTQLSIGIVVAAAAIALYAVYAVILNVIDLTVHLTTLGGMIGFGLAVLGLIFILLTFDLISQIARCALLYYQRNGKDPEAFDLSVVKAGMTVNKAKKLFS